MIKNSIAGVLVLSALAAQDDLKRRDVERIASRPPLTEPCKRVSELPPWKSAAPAVRLRLVMIPVAFSDDKGEESPAVAEKLAAYAKVNSGGALELAIRAASRVVAAESRSETARIKGGGEDEGRWIKKIFDKADLTEADAVCIAYAGDLESSKASVLWPHQSSIEHAGATRKYYVAPQSGASAAAVHAHEFIHLFGLKDKYERQSPHCILAYGYEPLRVCAACRAALGWASVAQVLPEPATRVRLGEFEKTAECLRVNLVSGGSEFLVIEFRDKAHLVWHTDSQGTKFCARIDGRASDRLTPFSDPKFRAKSAGSKPLFLTDVRVDETCATFKVSGNEPLTELEKRNLSQVGRVLNPK